MPWLPMIGTILTLTAGGSVATYQIGQNNKAIEGKVSVVEYDRDKDFAREARIRLATDIKDISESVDENEEAIEALERSDLTSSGDIKLQIERLQAEQRTLSAEQRRQTENIQQQLDLLLQLLRNGAPIQPQPFGQ